MSSKEWVRLPVEPLEDKKTSKTACLLLARIIDKADYGDGKGAVHPVTATVAEIADMVGRSIRTAHYAIKELIAAELISTKSTGRGIVITLTGAAATLPPKKRRSSKAAVQEEEPLEGQQGFWGDVYTPPKRSRRRKSKPEMTPQEAAEMEEYLSVVNRFKEDEVV